MLTPSFSAVIEPHPSSVVQVEEPPSPPPPDAVKIERQCAIKSEPCEPCEPSTDVMYLTIGAGILLGLIAAYAFSKRIDE